MSLNITNRLPIASWQLAASCRYTAGFQGFVQDFALYPWSNPGSCDPRDRLRPVLKAETGRTEGQVKISELGGGGVQDLHVLYGFIPTRQEK
jgi:hypothetical protein